MSITQGTSVRGTWVGPLVATAVTLPAALVAYDACDGAEAERFSRRFDTGFTFLQVGLLASFVLLLVSWGLPQTEPNVARHRPVLVPSLRRDGPVPQLTVFGLSLGVAMVVVESLLRD